MDSPEFEYLTPEEAGRLVGVTARSIRRAVAEGRLRGVEVGRTHRVSPPAGGAARQYRHFLIPRCELARFSPVIRRPPRKRKTEDEC